MPITVSYQVIEHDKFDYPFRIMLSGSSQSGKTFFARELLNHVSTLFDANIQLIKYYHPDYLATRPVSWHSLLSIPICYNSGVPTLSELCDLEPHTCVVLDDLYEECIQSKSIDYLFRVLSGKKNISVMIMTQRYFSNGKFGMNIRNQCNYTVLLRNVDALLNNRLASQLNLSIPVKKAIIETFQENYWPYIFIDSSPRGQVTSVRVYTDIFTKYKVFYTSVGMKAYIISETDFLQHFKIINKSTAKYESSEPLSSEPLSSSSTLCRESKRVKPVICGNPSLGTRITEIDEKTEIEESKEEENSRALKCDNQKSTFIAEQQCTTQPDPRHSNRIFDSTKCVIKPQKKRRTSQCSSIESTSNQQTIAPDSNTESSNTALSNTEPSTTESSDREFSNTKSRARQIRNRRQYRKRDRKNLY